ncbi:MAG: D-tyrosyl-tRNA(Tyr) deacylase [Fimbriimonadaceae bacterium]|nr:D-tyrosyl-tRNA(Tyr) deacylase [Fimbriimonadaceae bacterium]
MRAIVQRVAWARVSVDGNVIGQCGPGLLVLVGAHREDTEMNAARLADRIVKLRIFNDPDGKMNLAIGDSQGILVISNFTVYGETAKNRRPSFTDSAPYQAGKDLVNRFVSELRQYRIPVETGEFGADMQVELLNDGPVTVIVDA